MTKISKLLDAHKAAEKLETSYSVLAVWRCQRSKKLKYVKIGRRVFYREQDIEAFIAANTVDGDAPKPRRKKKNS